MVGSGLLIGAESERPIKGLDPLAGQSCIGYSPDSTVQHADVSTWWL